MVALSPIGGAGWQFFDSNGDPLAGGLLYTYNAGTTTPAVTYTNINGSTPNTNPIVLDSAGRIPEQIWLVSQNYYKFVLKTATGTQIWVKDYIQGAVTYQDFDAFTQSVSGGAGAAAVGFVQAGTGAVTRSSEAKMRDLVSVKDFGAVGDGVTNDYQAVQNWINYIVSTNKSGFVPAGTYLLGAKISVSNCDKVGIYGEGSRLSVFKRADNVVTSSFTEMFSLANKTGGGSQIVVKGIGFDGNARGNQIPVTVTNISGTFVTGEPLVGKQCTIGQVLTNQIKFDQYLTVLTAGETITGAISGATALVSATVDPYIWQQSHCIRTATTGSLAWSLVVFDDIWATDPTADVLGMGGNNINTYGHISVTNLFVETRNRVRSDITVTGSYQSLKIVNCKTFSTEVELNGYNPAGNQATVVSNLITDTLDLSAEGANDTTGWPPLTVTNCIVNGLAFFLGYSGTISNSQFLVNTPIRLVYGEWTFNGCDFLARSAMSTTLGLLYEASVGTNARALNVTNCTFEAQSGAVVPYYYYDDNAWGSNSTNAFCRPFAFEDCVFRGTTVRTAFLRGGKFSFNRCIHEYAGDAIVQSTIGSINDSELKFFGNIVVNAAGYLWTPPIAFTTAGVSVWLQNNISTTLGQIVNFTRYDKIAAPQGTATGVNAVLMFKSVDRQFESDVVPTTGKWLKSTVIWNSAPAPSGKVGWVVTTSGNIGTAVFKPFGAIDA